MTITDRTTDAGGRTAANVICTLSMIIWAMGFPAADRLFATFSPFSVAALRMGTAAVFLVAIWAIAEGPHALARASWAKGLLIGGLGFGFGSAAMLNAQQMTNSTTVAVVSSTLPVVGLAFEALFDGRRLSSRLIFGVLLSLAGGAAAILGTPDGLNIGLGALSAFVSVVTFAWGSRATVRTFPSLTPLGRTALTGCGAALATALLASLTGLTGQPLPQIAEFTPRLVGLILFSGLVSFALSQLLWIVSTEKLGIGVAAMHINAAPFYVMVLVYLLGGTWSWSQATAALVVGIGVLVAQMPARTART